MSVRLEIGCLLKDNSINKEIKYNNMRISNRLFIFNKNLFVMVFRFLVEYDVHLMDLEYLSYPHKGGHGRKKISVAATLLRITSQI